ncbi:hypothetical protein Vafri_4897 [Volvox africanus]|uniref:PLA2c domain-containing protein n=1 Tax=Volvox africanus TaxID=51714 RepID=A0A8J4AW54_9CHLO|nr:hypothetical protein Vafri_4897 [Volvox africanus]
MQVVDGTGSATATVSVEQTAPKTNDLDIQHTVAAPVPRPTTTVKAWVRGSNGSLLIPEVDDPQFLVPGLSAKAPVAVCISGGGFRATALALGWLRGLHHMGLLDKVRYLSTISGSSWMGAALCFQKDAAAVKDFLGTYLPPEQCTPEALQNVGVTGKSYAKAVADAQPLCRIIQGWITSNWKEQAQILTGQIKPPHEVAGIWTSAIAHAFLEPFGLHDVNTSTVRVPGTKIATEVADRAAKVGRAGNIYDANVKDLPFLIIGQAVILPKADIKFYPFEWTPLYGGCPVPYKDVTPKLGAGWVETLGLNAELVTKQDDTATGETKVEVRPMGPASLGEATGISSAYHSTKFVDFIPDIMDNFQSLLGFHKAQYFDMQDWNTQDVLLTDGGAYDLYGIYPALRRRVPNIMVFNCNGLSFKTMADFSSDKDLPGLFGCCSDEENKQRQVFQSAGFDKLFNAIQKKMKAGEAPIHVEQYQVLANDHLDIKGGWEVRIMWIMNERMKKWETQLPDATRSMIPD